MRFFNYRLVVVFLIFRFSMGMLHAAPLEQLSERHPRLWMDDAHLLDIKQQAETDPRLEGYVQQVLSLADSQLQEPVSRYEKPDGFRLLPVSRQVLKVSMVQSFAWRWTGEPRYLERVKAEMLAAADFPDWGPKHFLDVAEMTAALGIGYDWCYHGLSAEERGKIATAIRVHGIAPYLAHHVAARTGAKQDGVTWVGKENNWNLVVNGGVLVGTLAVTERSDTAAMNLARAVLSAALEQFPIALKPYEPDGAYAEGMMYWGYGTGYLGLAFTALESALGQSVALGDHPGLAKTGRYVLHATGPDGYRLMYSDANPGSRKSGRLEAVHFMFAERYDLPLLADLHHRLIELGGQAWPMDVVYYQAGSAETKGVTPEPLDAFFAGETPLVTFRSAWNDPQALYLSIVGGGNPGPHGHLDLGTVELRAEGVHWFVDWGKDDYMLPGFWETEADGRRWTYWRMGSVGHSVPRIGDNMQATPARADFTCFAAEADGSPAAIMDLSQAYPQAVSAYRGVRLLSDRQAAWIQDELVAGKDMDDEVVSFPFNTTATIRLSEDGKSAVLEQEGKRLYVEQRTDGEGRFEVVMAPDEPSPPHQSLPEGAKQLVWKTTAQSGVRVISALWCLPFEDKDQTKVPEALLLSDWTLPELEAE
jgi:hypothetical protein